MAHHWEDALRDADADRRPRPHTGTLVVAGTLARPPHSTHSTVVDTNILRAATHDGPLYALPPSARDYFIPYFDEARSSDESKTRAYADAMDVADSDEVVFSRAPLDAITHLVEQVAAMVDAEVEHVVEVLAPCSSVEFHQRDLQTCLTLAKLLARGGEDEQVTLANGLRDVVRESPLPMKRYFEFWRSELNIYYIHLEPFTIVAAAEIYRRSRGLPAQSVATSPDVCRMCGMFYCQLHPQIQEWHVEKPPLDRHRSPPPDYTAQDQGCSLDCWLVKGLDVSMEKVTTQQKTLLETLCCTFPTTTPCDFSNVLDLQLSCLQIATLLRTLNPSVVSNNTSTFKQKHNSSTKIKTSLLRQQSKSLKEKLVSRKCVSPLDEQCSNLTTIPRYVPCRGTERPCEDGSCTCSESTYCDRFCQCPITCRRRWRGCQCPGSCSTSCPCRISFRECDPLICGCLTHEWTPLHEVTNDLRQSKLKRKCKKQLCCKNTTMLMNKPKRTFVGESNVAGWGLFAGEDLKINDYVGEYKGEILDHETVEIRSNENFIRKTSFLFDVTGDSTIDNSKFGNRTRYINEPGVGQFTNVFAQVRYVLGSTRIGIFVHRELKVGDELLLDYGPMFIDRNYVKGQD